MINETILYRQVHPTCFINGHINRTTFLPNLRNFSKDDPDPVSISAYNGDMIDAKSAYEHYVYEIKNKSIGVVGIKCKECKERGLYVNHDRLNYQEHVSIVYKEATKGKIRAKAKMLTVIAEKRGWQFFSQT